MALRIIKGYRTISYSASCIIAGIMPIDIHIREIVKRYEVEKGFSNYEDLFRDNLDMLVCYSQWIHPGKIKESDKFNCEVAQFSIQMEAKIRSILERRLSFIKKTLLYIAVTFHSSHV